ncbi:uncharacterized protein EV154DRAFT_481915 [Mucor mucedo]|uniref:uncharacterized protein n=1 Tax=Mucor mucedo TaxID=29922 RepID=UPI00221E3B8C|nr:uncharacterized protein EV154DRAFT_481915 [Mucor mucedo]KAI7890652.1 hypothetical protein EV154DRAFT_481915 [Mucor mucedo]
MPTSNGKRYILLTPCNFSNRLITPCLIRHTVDGIYKYFQRGQVSFPSFESTPKNRKVAKDKKYTTDEFFIEEPATEYVDDNNESNEQDSSEPMSKGTTATHLIKFMNVLLCVLHPQY